MLPIKQCRLPLPAKKILMFRNRYWREYPMWMQVLLFGLMIFTLVSFFSLLISVIIPRITGHTVVDTVDITSSSPRSLIDAFLLVQGLSSIGIFLVPALLFSYLTHPSPSKYLGLRKPGAKIQWLLVIIVVIGALPVLLGIQSLVNSFNLGEGLKKAQARNEEITKAILTMDTSVALVKSFIVIAIIPAIAEELLFRGIAMRMLHSPTKKIGIAIVISAFLFSIVHSNPTGLLSIFFAGVVLGTIYYLTGSLWLSMLGHMINNGLQVAVVYMGNSNPAIKSFVEGDYIPWQWPVIGLVVFAASFYLLWKYRTPLPDDWSDNFRGEEREKNNWDLFRKNEDETDQLN
jgi:membrane protease YdiL (CAAX protease family)